MIPLLLSVFLITSHLAVSCHMGEFQAEIQVYGKGKTYVTLLKEKGKVEEIFVNGKELNRTISLYLNGYERIEVKGKASPGSEIILGIYQGNKVCAGEEVEIEVKKCGESILPWALFLSSLSLIYLLRRWRR